MRRAPVGVMPVCCKPQDSSSLLCSVVCPPRHVAQRGLVGRPLVIEKTHAFAK